MGSLLLAVAIGLAVGVVVGALGAGGGILAVPVLVLLLDQSPHAATASSLVIVLCTALASIAHRARGAEVACRQGLVFAGCSVLGGVLGSRASLLVDGNLLLGAFSVLLAAVAVVMLRRGLTERARERMAEQVEAATDAPAVATPERSASWPLLILAATATGLLTGFFGVGGGFVVVPMLVIALGMGTRRAAGTSLLVMIIASAVGLVSRADVVSQIDWGLTLAFAAGSMTGGVLGGPLSHRARASTLTLAFAALLGVIAAVAAGSLVV